jgi:hypothetical protein
MKKSEKSYVDTVERELDALLANPRACEVIMNDWFVDGSLPIPSPDLIEFLTVELLHGHGKYERFVTAATKGPAEAVRGFIVELRGLSPDSRRRLIVLAAARRKVIAMIGLKPTVLHSYLAVSVLDSELPSPSIIANGERHLMRVLVESVTLRSIFHSDGPRLDGLGEAVRLRAGTSQLKPKAREVIALQILNWHPFLSHELARHPSKTEMEMFLGAVHPDISDSSATWRDAWKLIPLPTAEARRRRIDQNQIIKLANKARETGPKVKRVPKWRIPPPAKTFKKKAAD